MRLLAISSWGLFLVAGRAGAVDYAKIDRTIAKEPAYTSKAPKYALLLFGPEARLLVWIVLDGKAVYLDRNGDGDLTSKGERFESLDFVSTPTVNDAARPASFRSIAPTTRASSAASTAATGSPLALRRYRKW